MTLKIHEGSDVSNSQFLEKKNAKVHLQTAKMLRKLRIANG